MGKVVKVVTKCGEEHVYKYAQEVETVEIVEEKKGYRLNFNGERVVHMYVSEGYYLQWDGSNNYDIMSPEGILIGFLDEQFSKGELLS